MPHTFLTRATMLEDELVASTGSVESPVLPLAHVATLESLILKAASVLGAADVKLEYVTSPDGINFESYSDTTDITSSQATEFPNNVEGFNPLYPPADAPMNGYIKFKVTGVGANPADTLVTLYAILREGNK